MGRTLISRTVYSQPRPKLPDSIIQVTEKWCSKCQQVKLATEFYKDKSQKTGLTRWCRGCFKEKYQQNRKHHIARQVAYAKSPAGKESHKRYRQSDHGLAQQRKNNKSPAGRACMRRFQRTEKGKIGQLKYKWAKRAGGPSNAEAFFEKFREFGERCYYCGTKLTRKTVTVDHMTPVLKGGTNAIDNLTPACKSCNSQKHARTVAEYTQKFGKPELAKW